MTELNKRARELLLAVDGGDDPSIAEKRRVKASVLARVGASAGVVAALTAKSGAAVPAPVVPAASSASPALAKASVLGLVTKTSLAVMVAALGVRGYAALAPATPAARLPRVEAVSRPMPRSTEATPSPIASAAPSPASPIPAVPPPSSRSEAPTRRESPPAVRAAITNAATAALDAETFSVETAELGVALDALAKGRADDALRLLGEQDARYPSGALGEERQAARIDALCALGQRARAGDLARQFLQSHRRSLLASRIAISCGVAPP